MTDGNQCITVESLSNQHLACLGEVFNYFLYINIYLLINVKINLRRNFFFFLYTLLLSNYLVAEERHNHNLQALPSPKLQCHENQEGYVSSPKR